MDEFAEGFQIVGGEPEGGAPVEDGVEDGGGDFLGGGGPAVGGQEGVDAELGAVFFGIRLAGFPVIEFNAAFAADGQVGDGEDLEAAEEEVCCGFGGTYSAKFPEVSAALLRKKLDGIADTGASRVVMDCPGCVLQIRGGAEKDGKGLKVTHIAELLAENLKK